MPKVAKVFADHCKLRAPAGLLLTMIPAGLYGAGAMEGTSGLPVWAAHVSGATVAPAIGLLASGVSAVAAEKLPALRRPWRVAVAAGLMACAGGFALAGAQETAWGVEHVVKPIEYPANLMANGEWAPLPGLNATNTPDAVVDIASATACGLFFSLATLSAARREDSPPELPPPNVS